MRNVVLVFLAICLIPNCYASGLQKFSQKFSRQVLFSKLHNSDRSPVDVPAANKDFANEIEKLCFQSANELHTSFLTSLKSDGESVFKDDGLQAAFKIHVKFEEAILGIASLSLAMKNNQISDVEAVKEKLRFVSSSLCAALDEELSSISEPKLSFYSSIVLPVYTDLSEKINELVEDCE